MNRSVAVCATNTGRSRSAVTEKADQNFLKRQGLRIDLNGVLDLNRIVVPGQHIGKLHHAGRASRRHNFRAAGDHVVALSLAHLERQIVVGQRERTAATAATVGFGHFHKVIARIHTDEIAGLLAHAEGLLEVAGFVIRHLRLPLGLRLGG